MPVTALSSPEVKAGLDACEDNEYARTFMLLLLDSGLAMVDVVQINRATGLQRL
jgi:hypothetical protein